jgi:TRAP-type C4-dicarboxylate transport system permease large subunit
LTFLVIGKWSARRPAAGPPLEATSRAMLPYLAVPIVGVLVVAFVPWFTLAVPRLIQGN